MPEVPLTIELRCRSWAQLAAIKERDLTRGALFVRSQTPPPVGKEVHIVLSLPQGKPIELHGHVREHIGPGGLEGRGPGADIELVLLSAKTMQHIVQALQVNHLDLDTGNVSPAHDRALTRNLAEEVERLTGLSAFQRLEVPMGASDQDVEAAFFTRSKEFHPDQFANGVNVDTLNLASEVYRLLETSYRLLRHENARKELEQHLRPYVPESTPPKVHNNALAPRSLTDVGPTEVDVPAFLPQASSPELSLTPERGEQGLRLMGQGKYDEALRILWIEYRATASDKTRANIEVAEGLRALTSGNRFEAAEHFEMALDLDPSNERAAQEIVEMQRAASEKRRGLLSQLMNEDE